ncbi:hypothetical protein [Nocardiopsis alba]|uniref:hypothetical protein n=1 Tax=Nocardiopsis alba TaxID=53437 RepID=UPI0035D9FFC1
MTEEFRAAFQRVLDTAAGQTPDFPEAVREAFRLSSHVPAEELETALEALAPVLGDCEPYPGVAADLSVLAGALVESGAPAGQVGLEVLRQVGSYGQAAVAFLHAWEKTGGGPLPAPSEVSEAEEKRVEEVLGENAPLATMGWWTVQRYGLAAKAMLSDAGVRSAVRADAGAMKGLGQIVQALSTRLSEFGEISELLRMAEVSRVLVLDRASRRGFRVRFDGVGDNFQLHTLLADALIGKEGMRLPGSRPDPRWVAASLDAPVDPLADVVRGEWDLVGGDGTWVGNEACPGDIPEVNGERVLVLEPQSLLHSWRAGRRHPHINGEFTVLSELTPDEAASWWTRLHPAGAVRHPQAPPIENDDAGTDPAPRHFGEAAHFAEVDPGPSSVPFPALSPEADPSGPDAAALVEPGPSSALPFAPDPEPLDEEEDEEFPGAAPWAGAPVTRIDEEDLFPVPDAGPFRDPDPLGGPIEPPSDLFDGRPEATTGLFSPAPVENENPPPSTTTDERTPENLVDEGPAPGSRLLPPLPPGVSDSFTWAPHWKWPAPPRRP